MAGGRHQRERILHLRVSAHNVQHAGPWPVQLGGGCLRLPACDLRRRCSSSLQLGLRSRMSFQQLVGPFASRQWCQLAVLRDSNGWLAALRRHSRKGGLGLPRLCGAAGWQQRLRHRAS